MKMGYDRTFYGGKKKEQELVWKDGAFVSM